MTESSIQNARIRSTMLGIEDHGILTCYVNLEGDGWGIGFGGYALDAYSADCDRREGTAYGAEFIRRILSTLEVNDWEKLPGTIVRCESEGWGGVCLGIGHAYKDRWFRPRIDLADYVAKRGAQ